MFNTILFFILGTFRVLAGAVVGLMAVGFVITDDISNLFLKGLAYLGCLAIALLLMAWGAAYFGSVKNHMIGWKTFAFFAVLTISNLIGTTIAFMGSFIGEQSALAIALYAPVALAIGWVCWTLFQTMMKYRDEDRALMQGYKAKQAR